MPFLLLLFLKVEAKKPPGYVEKPREIDPDPPKYEYGYKIKDQKAEQGKDEKREGQFSQGSFYVKDTEDGTKSKKNIKYFTDDWGFHTIAEYSNEGPNSKSSVTFIQDQEALKYKNNGNIIPDLDPNNNGKKAEDDPSNQKTSLPQPVLPTLPTTPLLTQEQIVVDPNQSLDPGRVTSQPIRDDHLQNFADPKVLFQNQPPGHEDPSQRQILGDAFPQEHRSVAEDPNQLQFFYIQPNNPQENVQYTPTALDNQYNQLQQILLQGEILPAPQPLIYNPDPSFGNNNDINIPTGTGYQTNIVHTLGDANILPSAETSMVIPKTYNHIDFGSKITPLPSGTTKLIESTKHLVSGNDVININESIENSNPEIETSTLQSLLQHYVTPSLDKELTNAEINHFGEGSSRNLAPIPENEASLLHQPIVVADEDSPNSSEKPVVDKNLVSEGPISDTARNTLNIKEPADILVTPRPIGTNFLAPITAGVQLGHTEQLMQDTKFVEQQHNNENVVVSVQKSVPHYLGKYEYPTAYASAYSGQNISDFVKEDLELGTTLLHFTEAPPHAEKLVQELPKAEQQQIFSDITSNHLNVQQENLNIYSPSQFYPQQLYDVELPAYPVGEKFVGQYSLQSYPAKKNLNNRPLEIQVPYPQPYPVENEVVEKPLEVKVPYHPVPVQNKKLFFPNKHHATVKNQIPWYDQKKHDVYLFQVPKQVFQPIKHQKPWNHERKPQNVLYTNHYTNYAPQTKNYLSPKQSLNIDRGYLPIKTIKNLETEQFPRENIHNLPTISKNPGETLHIKGLLPPITQPRGTNLKNQGPLSNFRPLTNVNMGSNSGCFTSPSNDYGVPSNNGYLPPQQNNNNQDELCNHLYQQASIKNYFQVKPSHTEPLGLLPPKSSGLRYQQNLLPASSEPQGNWRYPQYQGAPLKHHDLVSSPSESQKTSSVRYQQFLPPSINSHDSVSLSSEPQKSINLRYQFQGLPSPSGPSVNQVFRGNNGPSYHQYEVVPQSQDSPKSGGLRYNQEIVGKRSPRSQYFDESSVRMEYGFMPPFKPSQKIREVLEVNPE